jgi:aldehyde:ferredoxin oxidoreductase
MPGYDPRGILGLALAYATSNRGACYQSAFMIAPEVLGKPIMLDRLVLNGKPSFVKLYQDFAAVLDSAVMCPFASFALSENDIATLLSAVTGISYSSQDLLNVGERIWNLERLFNLQAGFTCNDDTLPQRMFSSDGIPEAEFKRSIIDYYRLRGWDDFGVPHADKLKQLGITP